MFNENYGQPTSIDLVVEGGAGETLYMEAKLVEPGFGGCSVFRQGDCDGRNPVGDLSQCYLHHIGRLYWDRLREHGLLDLLVLQRYEGSRESMLRADDSFQEPNSWKETGHARGHGSEG